jgi:rhamnosyltransferase
MLTGIVIVTYNSNTDRLKLILNSLVDDGIKYFVSDNSTSLDKKEAIHQLCSDCDAQFIDMKGNVGIAKAQNVGIQSAIDFGCDDLLLLDDDSLPSSNMLVELIKTRSLYFDIYGKLPVICADAIAEDGRCLSQVGKKLLEDVYVYRDIISSGTLVSKEIFELVGLHEERLFIDCVDYEWGWRAANLGVDIILCKQAVLNHRLGNGRVKAINAGYGSPVRHYYQYRNILYMMGRNYVPSTWKLSQLIKLIVKPVVIVIFFDKKTLRLKYALKGFLDFIKKRYGSIDYHK